ncbi:MAG: hypothetical protein QNJ14_15580 [Woeseiaceae bacterium]|nr:hypothetical protein [Woeseiaceae bacterium]
MISAVTRSALHSVCLLFCLSIPSLSLADQPAYELGELQSCLIFIGVIHQFGEEEAVEAGLPTEKMAAVLDTYINLHAYRYRVSNEDRLDSLNDQHRKWEIISKGVINRVDKAAEAFPIQTGKCMKLFWDLGGYMGSVDGRMASMEMPPHELHETIRREAQIAELFAQYQGNSSSRAKIAYEYQTWNQYGRLVINAFMGWVDSDFHFFLDGVDLDRGLRSFLGGSE